MSKLSVRRTILVLALAVVSGGVLAQKAAKAPQAAPWPTKPLRLLVGFPGGSTPDLVARTIAEPLSRALGQPVVVENRPGAGGNIAADIVAKSSDNHTIGVMINGNMTIAKLLNPATPFDPLKDLAPISLIGTAPLLLTAPATAQFNNAQEFFAAARTAGDKWSYGTPGIGTVGHIGMELLKTRTNIHPVHVPYPGNPQVINAMIGGQIHLSLLPPGLAAAQIRAGKLKAVGVTSAGRSPLVPEYPSLGEGGVPGFQLEIWTAAAGPASLPKPIVAKLSSLIGEIARTPEVRQKLFQQGWQVAGTSSEGLANRVKADTALLGGVIATRGIKAE
jgi:tripartite-type tricarboxylate transporter receptor subunit TctC